MNCRHLILVVEGWFLGKLIPTLVVERGDGKDLELENARLPGSFDRLGTAVDI